MRDLWSRFQGSGGFKHLLGSAKGVETTTFEVGGMTCGGCVSNLKGALEAVEGVSSVDAEIGKAVVHHDGACSGKMGDAIEGAGFTIGEPVFDWKDGSVWKQSAHNTKWCLIGCSIGDFGTIAAFQFIPYLDALGWSTMSIMLLAMFNGIMTSIALETIILSAQMAMNEAFRVAIGMSLISMISMEAAMNIVDVVLTGGAKLTLWVIVPMLVAGFLTPWPYNYWRLKKYGMACH